MRAALVFLGAFAVASCGGGSYGGGTPAGPGPNPGPNPYTITITANTATPQTITVPAGSRVLFRNQDSRAHEMHSDPHPEHGDCPPVDDVGHLAPGQARETTNLVTVGTCRFHDHLDPDRPTLKGSIIIQ
jgi:hypothetical protein